jgi:hypothetical protein
MGMQTRVLLACVFVLNVLAVAGHAAATDDVTRDQRREAIRHARVWSATNVRAMDIKRGPQGPFAFPAGETVTCEFTPKEHGKGSTPKFECAMTSGRALKVRYGKDNGEVYAQVAATRLLWALGFAATRMYPVKLVCRGCPPDPFKERAAAPRSGETRFDPATIEVKADGETIETKPDEGWSWDELDLVDEKIGGASVRERDALKLLAALMQHSSSKAINQRILCLDAPACRRTELLVLDVGKTFGRANMLNNDNKGAVNYKAWAGMPMWKESTGCVADLPGSLTGTLHNPRISEEGRRFLADLLNQLGDVQIRDLFDVARFTERDPSASLADWITAFKAKREAIATRTCP